MRITCGEHQKSREEKRGRAVTGEETPEKVALKREKQQEEQGSAARRGQAGRRPQRSQCPGSELQHFLRRNQRAQMWAVAAGGAVPQGHANGLVSLQQPTLQQGSRGQEVSRSLFSYPDLRPASWDPESCGSGAQPSSTLPCHLAVALSSLCLQVTCCFHSGANTGV